MLYSNFPVDQTSKNINVYRMYISKDFTRILNLDEHISVFSFCISDLEASLKVSEIRYSLKHRQRKRERRESHGVCVCGCVLQRRHKKWKVETEIQKLLTSFKANAIQHSGIKLNVKENEKFVCRSRTHTHTHERFVLFLLGFFLFFLVF